MKVSFQKVFRSSNKTFQRFRDEIFGHFCANCFDMSMATFRLNIYFLTESHKHLYFCDCCKKRFWAFGRTVSSRWWKFFSRIQTNKRGIFVSDKNCSSVHFWSLSVNYSDVCENWFVNVKESVPKWKFFLEVK